MKRSQGAVALVIAALFTSILAVSQPAHALLCVESCVPEPPPPPEPPAGCQYAIGTATVIQTGTVKDPFGAPIAGAKVYNWCKSATTNASGLFSLLVPVGDSGQRLTAKGTVHYYRERSLPSPVGSVPVNFEGASALPYLVGETISVSPDAVNTLSSQVTIRLDATAPLTGARVLVQLPAGGRIVLTHDVSYASPAGWSRWTATTLLPSNFPLGRQTIYACVLKATAPGSEGCFEPESSQLISQVRSHAIAYDQTPPARISSAPAAFSSITSPPASISVTIADQGGAVLAPGLFPTRLDGQTVAASRSGDTISVSGAGLGPGVHLIEVDAADTAGNAVSIRSLFTIVTLTATDATATLREQTVQVNPTGGAPPSSVTLIPHVDVIGFAVALNATTETGLVTFHRAADFPAAVVTFRRTDGAQIDQTVSIAGQVDHRVGLVAPSARELSAVVAATSATLGSIAVPVPAGFGVAGTTVTLGATTVSLGPPAFNVADPVVPARPAGLALTIASCFRVTVQCSSTGGQTVSGYFPQLGWQSVAAPAGALPDNEDESVFDPGCRTLDRIEDSNPCGQEPKAGSNTTITPYQCPIGFPAATPSTRCGLSNLLPASAARSARILSTGISLGCGEQFQGIDLCSGSASSPGHLAALYQTPFAYSQAGCLITQSNTCAADLGEHPATFLVWHQVKASPGTTQCPEGLGNGNLAKLIRLYTTYGPSPDSNYLLKRVDTTVRVDDSAMPQAGGPYWAGFMEGSLYQIVHAIPASRIPPEQTSYSTMRDRSPTLNDDLMTADGTGTSMWPQDIQMNIATSGDLEMYSGAEFRLGEKTNGAASVSSATTAIFDLSRCTS